MKKKIIILFIAFLSVLTIGCNNNSKEREKKSFGVLMENPEIEKCVNFLIEFPKSNKKQLIYESLDSLLALHPNTGLISRKVEVGQDKKLILEFSDIDDDAGDYYLKERNTYLLTLGDRGLFHNGKSIEISDFEKDLRKKFFEWEKEDNATQRKVDEIKYFGFVLVSKFITVLDTKENTTKINWNNYFKCIDEVFSVYKSIWNEKSIEIWNKKFDSLEIEKKNALLETYPLRMELNFAKRTFRIK